MGVHVVFPPWIKLQINLVDEEMVHVGGHSGRLIEDLGQVRNLPIQLLARDTKSKAASTVSLLFKAELDVGVVNTDAYLRMPGLCQLEDFRATDESGKLGHLEVELIEERYFEAVESGSVDSGQEVLQVSAGATEIKCGKGWKDTPC